MKKIKNKIKDYKAITLIALVITIIVLLILAGITVAQLSGNNLFENAKLAKEKYKKSRDLEDEIIGDYEDAITGDRGNKINYSFDEQEVGTYFDGKTIYQKTVDCGALPNASLKQVAHGISNLDNLVNLYGVTRRASGARLVLPYTNPAAVTNLIEVYCDNNNIFLNTGSNRTDYTSTYITLQYTKTTD